ncbi:MAG: sigma 54 modulation/S30EA ribosomal C-terminal domain-containing protein, partial [Pseudomonadota bacterium]
HHNDHKDPLPAESAPAYVLAPLPDETDAADDDGSFDDEASNPIVVAESKASVLEMTVSDAVMQLDLAEQPAIVFKNAAHGRLNVVYRRSDGNIGWVDPQSP